MQRETLSRSLLYSHNLLRKSAGSFTGSRLVKPLGRVIHHRALFSPSLSPSRGYHRSWETPAQSIAEAKTPSTASINNGEGAGDPSSIRPVHGKPFNIRARDILSMPDPDEPISPSPSLISAKEEGDVPSNVTFGAVDSKIVAARTTEELLSLTNEQELTLKHSCQIISRLGSIAQGKGDKTVGERIRSDLRFVRLFNLIQRGNHAQFPHTLLQALNGLQKLGLEHSVEVSRLVERELSWSMRRCPLKFLAKSVRILRDSTYRESSTTGSGGDDSSILQSAIKVLHRRWIEAITGSDFISLFQIIELFDDERKTKIEDRAADVAHQYSPLEMLKLFVVLGEKRRRPTPLLRALAFHYSKSEYKCNAKEAIELIYSLNELTFADPILMNKLCADVSEEISHVRNVALISSLMTSLGQMRYKQKDILLAADEWIMKRLDRLRVFDFAAWLQAAATLNHASQNLPIFCARAQEVLTQPSVSSPSEWVNIVHAFAVLNHLHSEMLSSVLNPSFVESIDKLGLKATKQKIKLLNLNALASKGQVKDYKGPLLSEGTVKDWSETFVTSSDEKLSKLVIDSLATFLPSQKYLEMNCNLPSGVFVDAKCFLDSKMMPITLEAAKSKTSKSTQKVAFVVEGYSAMCLGSKQPTGQASLNTRILEADDFVVINVPYTEFGHSDKLVRRVQYLEQKLKSVSQNNEDEAPFPGK